MFIELWSDYSAPKYWPTWIGLALLRCLSFLPLPVLAVIGYLFGTLIFLLNFPRRRIAFENLKACFPEFSAARLHLLNWQHWCFLGHAVMTASMNWWISERRFDRLVSVHNREHYDQALAEGRRVILLAPHFIGLEASGLALQRERPMVGMYQYMKNGLMDATALKGRQRFCPDGIMFERKAPLRTLLRILMRGYPFWWSPDQDAMRKGVFVPFFHTLASTTPALSKFIQVTNAVVIPCRNHIRPWGRGYDVYLGEPIAEELASGDEEVDTAAMNRAIEAMVREDPAQYLWVHKRFKTRPPGDPDFYR